MSSFSKKLDGGQSPRASERLSENWEIGDLITHTNYADLVALVVVAHVATAKVHVPRAVGIGL